MKNDEKTSWLKNVDSMSLIQTAIDLDGAFKKAFKHLARKPKFKQKSYQGSYASGLGKKEADGCINFKEGYIKLRKAGIIKTVFHREFRGTPKCFTISKKSFDWYEVSILVDDDCKKDELRDATYDGTIGIDLGVKKDSNVILSDGTKFKTINAKILEERLKRLQRRLARQQWFNTGEKVFSRKYNKEINKKVPSRNYIKTKDKIAKIHAKIERMRSYNTHQITSFIAHNDNIDTVCIEDLNVSGMTRNKHLSKSVSNANMGEIRRQLEYKCDWNGKNVVKVGRFYPSSQTCSVCGYINKEVKNLSVRSWVCPNCGTKHDRDVNAALNIKKEGYQIITQGKKQGKA